MRFEIYINKVLFYETSDCDDAFAFFRDWLGRGHDVRIQFIRTRPLAA